MKKRLLAVLAWGLWVLSLAMVSFAVALSQRYASSAGALERISYAVAFSAFAAVGALITTRQPGNRIGWIFSAIGVGTGFTLFDATISSVLQLALTHKLPLPIPWFVTPDVVTVFDLLGSVVWSCLIAAFLLLLLVFPTGRLLSRRWRIVVWVMVINLAIQLVQGLMDPLAIANGLVRNPLTNAALLAMINALGAIFPLILLGILVAAVTSVVLRFRRAHGVEKQQLKWFTYGTAVMIAVLVGDSIVEGGGVTVAFGLGILILPVIVAIAILRYRLFDIDILINRTLVYGSLTALLAGVYFGSVLLLQHLAVAFAGQGADANPLILVLSTLLIAALFMPLRGRLQRTIDRRFYRAKYDAAKTLERFAATLRGEVNLTDLERHLVGVVEETMQPAHISLWLRTEESGRESPR